MWGDSKEPCLLTVIEDGCGCDSLVRQEAVVDTIYGMGEVEEEVLWVHSGRGSTPGQSALRTAQVCLPTG